ncbi:phosphate/phosphite/phosphonate ABC transporter substrate-binding protein [Dechloromonas sp. A34]|uniref:phosphate/phosphite/phosphonate ABC transporter substrate-binding protein n=1 Tax=Dechloromonas sp. A34 TaxID=447588 RepID=UPI002249219E|nr:phosphate/phosphite/phosphonate ABC transporter substrate-binding protein [Dechloromonas sp. A34]
MLRTFLGYGLWLVSLLVAAPAAGQEVAPLRLAVHPYASTLALINTHRPLQQYLAARLGRPVEFYTAPNFDGFVDALLAGSYDIAISPPHFAVMAMDKDYVPLVHYRSRLEPLLVVRSASPIRQPADFRGKQIAMADRTSFIRLVAVKWLADNGLIAGRDYQIVERPSHGATVAATAAGEVDAGLATATALKQLPSDLQQQVRIINTGQRFPHLFTMAHRRLGEPLIARLKSALLAFPETDEGRQFMEKSAYLGYEAISAEEISVMKPYVETYRRMDDRR